MLKNLMSYAQKIKKKKITMNLIKFYKYFTMEFFIENF